MTKGKKQMKIAVIKNSLFRKLMLVICFCLLLYSQIYISFAITGSDFDPSKPVTCAITLPRFSSGPRYCSDIGDSRGPCVYANVNFRVTQGSTANCWGDGKDVPIWYEGIAFLKVDGRLTEKDAELNTKSEYSTCNVNNFPLFI